MNADIVFDDASALFSFPESPLDTASAHRFGGAGHLFLISSRGREEPDGMSMRRPVVSQKGQGVTGQGDIAIFGPFSAVDVHHEALAIDVGDLQKESLLQAQSQVIDGGEVDAVMQRCGHAEQLAYLLDAEDGGETLFGLSPNEVEEFPVALDDMAVEEADTAVTDAHGAGSKSILVFSM